MTPREYSRSSPDPRGVSRELQIKNSDMLLAEETSSSTEEEEHSALSVEGSSEESKRTRLAGRMLEARILNQPSMQTKLEKSSVYGQAMAIPQLARSANWPRGLTGITGRTFLYLFLNCFLQVMLLCMIYKEEMVMDKFGGQMNLCDFGAFTNRCPDGPDCTGPAGTKYTPSRLYGWGQWVTRSFVRDSLEQLFPDKVEEIAAKVDPGEYGLEDYWCRLTAVFVFQLALMEEILNLFRACLLLWKLPSESESWISYVGEMPIEDHLDMATLDKGDVKLQIAGMSRPWKLFNIAFVLLPKFLILLLTVQAGTSFLMETASIENVIVNCVALTFLLSIDEMIFEFLNDRPTKAIMKELEEFVHHEEVIEMHKESMMLTSSAYLCQFFPVRLLVVVSLTFFSVLDYYMKHCVLRENGNWLGGFVSVPMYLPMTTSFSPLNAVFPWAFTLGESGTPYWTMPNASS